MPNILSVTSLLISFSTFSTIAGIYTLYTSWETSNWPATTALIIEINKESKGTAFGQKSSPLVTNINKAIYFYTVNSKSFTGSSVINSEFTVGKEITIYFNPTNPRQSTLYHSLNWLYFNLFIAVGLILAISAFFWRKHIKALTRRSIGTLNPWLVCYLLTFAIPNNSAHYYS